MATLTDHLRIGYEARHVAPPKPDADESLVAELRPLLRAYADQVPSEHMHLTPTQALVFKNFSTLFPAGLFRDVARQANGCEICTAMLLGLDHSQL